MDLDLNLKHKTEILEENIEEVSWKNGGVGGP